MKKFNTILVIILMSFILLSCDPRKRLSEKESYELFESALLVINNEKKWDSNFYYLLTRGKELQGYLLCGDRIEIIENKITYEQYVKNNRTYYYDKQLQTKEQKAFSINDSLIVDIEKNNFYKKITGIINNKDGLKITGWNSSVKFLSINIKLNEEKQEVQALINIAFRKDGSIELSLSMNHNSIYQKESIILNINDTSILGIEYYFPSDLQDYKNK